MNFASTANWEGLEDLQSGVFVYRWWVGSELGNDDVIAPTDPHMYLTGGQSAWTNMGLATDLDLEDGTYYISVQVCIIIPHYTYKHFSLCVSTSLSLSLSLSGH